jgi:hypothetical protein
MAEIAPSRIEPIADPGPGPGPQDQSASKQHAKAAAFGKHGTSPTPEIGAPEAEEKHELDEMA